jgi:hypothetical protein
LKTINLALKWLLLQSSLQGQSSLPSNTTISSYMSTIKSRSITLLRTCKRLISLRSLCLMNCSLD